jgi:hypothetical protein
MALHYPRRGILFAWMIFGERLLPLFGESGIEELLVCRSLTNRRINL